MTLSWLDVLKDAYERAEEEYRKVGYVKPRYGERSLADLSSSIVALFRGEAEGLLEPLVGRSKLLLVVVDSLGVNLLLSVAEEPEVKELLKTAKYVTWLTSVAPSTTATALVSIATAAEPIRHAVLGYRMYLREVGAVVRTLDYSPAAAEKWCVLEKAGVHPRLVELPTIFEALALNNVKSVFVAYEGHIESKYTKEISRGSEVLKHISYTDVFPRAVQALSAANKLMVYAYWGELDTVSHVYGPESEEARFCIIALASILKRVVRAARSAGAGVVLLADHGQTRVDKSGLVMAHTLDSLMSSLLIPPYGERRFAYLKALDRSKLEESLHELGEGFIPLTVGEAVKRGIFGRGKPSRQFLERAGDYIILAKRGKALLYPYREKDLEPEGLGYHGGLTPEEVIVPLIIF